MCPLPPFPLLTMGGVTRLTEPGLSIITEWRPTAGAPIPPLNWQERMVEFEKYKATPEFKLCVIPPNSIRFEHQPKDAIYRLNHPPNVRTELPWRNMINLTRFTLWQTPLGGVSIGQLLDFLESTPHLKKVRSATPTSGAQGGRLVSSASLEGVSIQGDEPRSLLLHHLLIPVGAKLSIWVGSFGPRLEGHLPRSLDNFRNLSNLTKISLDFTEPYIRKTMRSSLGAGR